MLDKQTASLLKTLTTICGDGGYKVIEIKDLLDKLPTKYNFAEDSIGSCMTYLADRSYIDIKYMENSVYCLACLPKARMYFENLDETDRQNRNFKKLFLYSVVVSSIASAVASFIAVLLAFLIFK